MEQDSILKTLQRIPWFLELNPTQMDALARIASLRDLPKDAILFNEGDAEDCFYVLIDGQLRIETHVPGHGQYLLYLAEPLDIVGWSVLTPVIRQRTGTVSANTLSRLICFNSKILHQLCEEDQHFGYVIMRRVANVVASRMLVTRLRLFELIHKTDEQSPIRYA
jgi:CRP/FNR family transcriptional regulator, cyclic AMP receptor protein